MGRAGSPGSSQPGWQGWTPHPASGGCWQLPAVTHLRESIDCLYPEETPLRIAPVKLQPLLFPARCAAAAEL